MSAGFRALLWTAVLVVLVLLFLKIVIVPEDSCVRRCYPCACQMAFYTPPTCYLCEEAKP